MKKKIWIASLFAAFSIMASASAVGVLTQAPPIISNADEIWQSATIENKYLYGTYFEVPTATVEVNGQSAAASATVTYPDGTATRLQSVPLNQSGKYTVTYRAVVNGMHCLDEKTFIVEEKPYLVQKAESSVVYDTYTEFGANSKGLLVQLAEGDALTFAQLIDVSALTGTEDLFEMFITPSSRGSYDFNKLIVTLTDAVDSSVYLRFQLKRYPAEDRGINNAYVSAGGNGQSLAGYESGRGYSTVNTKLHGTPISLTFTAQMHKNNAWSGEIVNRAPDAGKWTVSYNPYTMEATTGKGLHVANLNNLEVYESVWAGFTSGKARMTVTAEEVTVDTAKFCITKVLGIDLTEEGFSENDCPEIDVSMSAEEMPHGQVNYAYAIPSATAFDYYAGACDVNVAVYRDYATAQPISVSVVNGKFTPTLATWYTIVYTAQDALGNTSKEIRSVYVSNDLGNIRVSLPSEITQEAILGSWVNVLPATYTGDCGLASQKITVCHENGEPFEITDGFLPELAGAWTVKYTVTDYIGRVGSAEYTVNAIAEEKYVLLEEPILPQIYVSDSAYVLPELYATNYATGKAERTLCDVIVKDAKGEKKYTSGNSFIPSVTTNGDKVTVAYQCAGKTIFVKEIPAVLVRGEWESIIAQNYLYGEGFGISYKDVNGEWLPDGISVVANEATDICGWTFATPQLADEINLLFQGEASRAKFKSLQITLTDAEDPDRQIALNIGVRSGSVVLTSGQTTAEVSGKTLITDEKYEISYKSGKFAFDGVAIAADLTTSGEAFEGFSSDYVYIKVDMYKAQANAGYILRSVCNAGLSYENLEVFAPRMKIYGDFSGNKSFGETVEIAPAFAHDVFSPLAQATLTVKAPDGSIVVDNNGVTLQDVPTNRSYAITLTSYGQYKVIYTAMEKDWVKENVLVQEKSILVIDEKPPQAKFEDGAQTTAKVGDVIAIPKLLVKDDVTATENIRIVAGVYNPNGRYIRFKDGENAIKCAYEGEYTFFIMVFDAYGNMTSVKHTVTVTK